MENIHNSSSKKSGSWVERWEDMTTFNAAETFYESIERILEKQGISLDKVKLLELGSGNTVFLNYFLSKGVDAIGIDTRPRGDNSLPQVAGNIEHIPFADESFEVVIASNVFDKKVYGYDHHLMMKEIARVLKSGGIFIGLTETIDSPQIEGLNLIPDDSGLDIESIYKNPNVKGAL